MFAGISNYIWGTSSDDCAKSPPCNKEKPSKNRKPNTSMVTTDSGDESDSWVLVEEPSKASKVTCTSTKNSANRCNSNVTGGFSLHSGKSSSTPSNNSNCTKSTNHNSNSKCSRRSGTRLLVSSSQVPVKVAPVRRPIRRHRQSSEQSLEDFPSLASHESPLGQAVNHHEACKSTTYAQVLATANSSSTSTVDSNVHASVHLKNVQSSSCSLPSPSLSTASTENVTTNGNGKAPAILVVDQQLLKKKGTGSPKSKKSRRHEATDEEWFMTPPPCFTRPNTFDMAKSPIEDMLIEQPVPNTETPSTPSSIELDTCSLSSRESSLQGRKEGECPTPTLRQTQGDKEEKKYDDDEAEETEEEEEEEEEETSEEEEEEEREKNKKQKHHTAIDKAEDEATKEQGDEQVVAWNKSSKVATTKVETSAGEEGEEEEKKKKEEKVTTKTEPVLNSSSYDVAATAADSQGEAEEEPNENWAPPVVKARQRLNSKGRLALDTYTVVSRKERRKKKKISPKSTANGSNSDSNGNNSNDKHSNDWTRPAWSDASVANGSNDAVGASSASTAAFAPSLKLMLKAVNRAQQDKIQWITNTIDNGHFKSGPLRRKDKYAARPHSFCLNRKTNRNF